MLRPPKVPKKRPGPGFFYLLVLIAGIVAAIVWAFNAH